MRFILALLSFVALFFGCKTSSTVSSTEHQNTLSTAKTLLKQKVGNKDELYQAISNAKSRDNIVMANGV